jgi:hypothetical protein
MESFEITESATKIIQVRTEEAHFYEKKVPYRHKQMEKRRNFATNCSKLLIPTNMQYA